MFEVGQTLHGFVVQSCEELPEIDGKAIVMKHGCGARLLHLANEDDNKSFAIAFPTPPADDTGVFHILEHSVLCGSKKFPVKEPFVNLLKTSMQTFLNAMTFADKTMYPVASTNQQDLLNLIDVYMDAVLNPAIYTDRHIFEQEGHHYELEDGKLVYNGVVFNEMKGALSDPESVLYHAVNRALFPDSCYAFESGGHPRAIPTLTYEDFLDTHARHYRLDNAYIVLYGNLDVDAVLGHLDREYLGVPQPQAPGAPNPIGSCSAPAQRIEDGVVEMDTAPENACVGIGYVFGEAHDFERVLAVDILLDALMGGNESPLKRAVLDAGIGGDCSAFLLEAQANPTALLLLKNATPDAASKFRAVVEGEARRLVDEGIPRDVLEAALSQMAFDLRERDRGIADGVSLAIDAMAGWLYSDDDATTCLHYEKPLAAMRAGLEGRYFEEVLSSLLLDNTHTALVALRPAKPECDEEALELAQATEQLTAEGRAQIEETVRQLREHQEAPDDPADLAKLPQLHVSDIGPGVPDPALQLLRDTPLPCLYHDIPSRHINYLRAYFGLEGILFEDLPYAVLLAMLFGNLDTAEHTAAELDSHIRTHLGGLRFLVEARNVTDPTRGMEGSAELLGVRAEPGVHCHMLVRVSALAEESSYLAGIPREIWETTRFDDAGRIRDILVQKRIALEEAFTHSGHQQAIMRVGSYLEPLYVVGEHLSGVEFYRFLCDLIEHFDERFDDLSVRLDALRKRIFVKGDCIVSFTGTPAERDEFWSHAGDWDLPDQGAAENRLGPSIPEPQVLNEAFFVPSDVCFTAKGANLADFPTDNGIWPVLTRVLSYDYLWKEVRVKGGAYGCGFKHHAQGFANFYSYRDPQVDATLERFDAAGSWLAGFAPEANEMEGYIVSTVAKFDTPTKLYQMAARQDLLFFNCKPQDNRERLRAESLACTPEDIRALAPALDALAARQAWCTFGNQEAIESADAPFKDAHKLL